mmetsp:Transcript_406/g.1036  ORF Transcript_406/g.1036 Transcript_406/m.1036 type:complete len:244 (-) Transcript_406:2-733(-)
MHQVLQRHHLLHSVLAGAEEPVVQIRHRNDIHADADQSHGSNDRGKGIWVVLKTQGDVHAEDACRDGDGGEGERQQARLEVQGEDAVALRVQRDVKDLPRVVDSLVDLHEDPSYLLHLPPVGLQNRLHLQVILKRRPQPLVLVDPSQAHVRHVLVLGECFGQDEDHRLDVRSKRLDLLLQGQNFSQAFHVVSDVPQNDVHQHSRLARLVVEAVDGAAEGRLQCLELERVVAVQVCGCLPLKRV